MRFLLKLAQSAQLAEWNSKIQTKSLKIHSRGHFFKKKRPQWGFQAKTSCWITFHPFNRFSLATHRSIQLDNWKNMEISKMIQILFWGSNRGISIKNTPSNNFSTIQPIFKNRIPIDSAWQARHFKNIKILKILFLGSTRGIFRKNLPPTITFQPFNRFSLSKYRSIQLNKRKNMATSKKFQISL